MFSSLSERLQKTLKQVRGMGRITDDNIQDALRDIRMSLLEADVALSVVRSFTDDIRERAIGQEVATSLNPGQALVKIVHDELVHLMGDANAGIDLSGKPPHVILMAGLQGSGKTTTTAKLARYLKEEKKLKVLVTSCDIYRPAAIEQLATLARDLDIDCFPSTTNDKPIDIAKNAATLAANQFYDVLIVDTAGRLHIDDDMMTEIKTLESALSPNETLFVVDSMTGQDAANTAKAFHDALPLTGVVLTKTDGDARGGAALSIRHITGKPIKFMGVGEKTDALVAFHPDRVASRILGMGDVLTLVEEAERKVDKGKAEKLAKKIKKGKGFDLEDFRQQIEQMNKMGGMASIMGKLPGMGKMAGAINDQMGEKTFVRIVAMINSMTPQERRFPKMIGGSRKKRIANGSGTQIQDVNRLLKQFNQMQKMMKKVAKGGMGNMMRGMKGMMPNDFPGDF
jgi:signal recognition particle subunit SRP54